MLPKKTNLLPQAKLKNYHQHQQRAVTDGPSGNKSDSPCSPISSKSNRMLFLRRHRTGVALLFVLLGVSAFAIALDHSQLDEPAMGTFSLTGSTAYLQSKGKPGRGPKSLAQSSSARSSKVTKAMPEKLMVMEDAESMSDMGQADDAMEYGSSIVAGKDGSGKHHRSPGESVLQALEDSNSKTIDDKNTSELKMIKKLLFHSGNIVLSVPGKNNVNNLKDQIVNLIESDEAGPGYVESQSSYSSNVRYNSHGKEQRLLVVNLQLRVSSDKFHSVVDKIAIQMVNKDDAKKLQLASLSTSSRDVTDEFIDASSRASTIDASREALKALLIQTKSVSEVMEVNRELNRLTQQYESQKERAKYLQKQSLLSTLSVQLEERTEEVEDKPPEKSKIW
eukprot:CAMPEP_0195293868 /NCGR_PEP_ID=MMETSP0707-20130614/13570_1 /TAXON_ID=33640 /ORGANISM="Asterionellopsis glacialis, Strain CCMP134" /LENGTH=391 /DNA_ID=CAMNT_0040354679 /DNA_START=198 /DNA_END=1370 /DNA_ORIENTATION=+